MCHRCLHGWRPKSAFYLSLPIVKGFFYIIDVIYDYGNIR